MKLHKRIIVIGLFLILASCSSAPEHEFDYDHERDFTRLNTYSWSQGPRKNPRQQQVNQLIKQAISSELKSKGILESAKQPDFSIALYFGSKNKITHKSGSTRLYYYGKSGGDAYNISDDRLGSLTVDFFEPTSKKFIWRSTTRVELKNAKTDKELADLINVLVKAIFKNFPPQVKK